MSLGYTATLDNAPFLSGLQGIRGAMAGLSGALAPVAGLVAVLGGVAGAAALMGRSITEAANMETMETSFITLLGSVAAAKARMADLSKFAADTPFDLPEIAQASRTLETLTKGALSTGAGLTLVGDVASGVNQPFGEMSTTIGRLYDGLQSGRPVGEAMARLQELGIISGDTRGKLENLQASGAKGDAVWQVAASAMAKYTGSMKLQSGTWNGLISTLGDGISAVFREFGAPVMDALKPALMGLIEIVDGLAPKAQEFGTMLGTAIAVVTNAFKSGSLGTLAATALKIGLAEAVNFFFAGILGVIALAVKGFMNIPRTLSDAFKLLTDSKFWSGIGQALLAAAKSFGASLSYAIADVLAALREIPALRDMLDKPLDMAIEAGDSWAQSGAEENAKSAATDLTSAFKAILATVDANGKDGIAAFQKAFAKAPELINTAKMRDSQARLVDSLKPVAGSATLGFGGLATDLALMLQSTLQSTKSEAIPNQKPNLQPSSAADSYAKIGLFVGNGMNMQKTEQAKTNNLLGTLRDTVRSKVDGIIEAIKDTSRANGWS